MAARRQRARFAECLEHLRGAPIKTRKRGGKRPGAGRPRLTQPEQRAAKLDFRQSCAAILDTIEKDPAGGLDLNVFQRRALLLLEPEWEYVTEVKAIPGVSGFVAVPVYVDGKPLRRLANQKDLREIVLGLAEHAHGKPPATIDVKSTRRGFLLDPGEMNTAAWAALAAEQGDGDREPN